MTNVFFTVLNLSLSAGWLVLAIVILRRILRRAPRWIFPLFWGLVGLRLLLPFSIESALSLLPTAETVSPSIVYESAPSIHSGLSSVNSAVNPVLSEALAPDPSASVNPAQVLAFVLTLVWLAGAVLMLCYLAVSWLRVSLRLRTAVRLQDQIYQSEWARTPFLFGVIRPRIILPFSIGREEAAFVIAHEQAHLKRHDHWVKPFAFLLLSVYWFHPLLWLAWFLLCRDIELACDERVIRDMSREERAGYSQALLACSTQGRGKLVCPLAFGEAGVRERVKAVLSYRKPAVWVVALAIVFGIGAAVCFLTNPQTRETMVWAQNLSASDVQRIELVVMPQEQDKQYRIFAGDEMQQVVALINESRGRYVADPESLDGGSILFTVTMTDGETHTVSNIGNVYLTIDGEYFDAGYEWLSAWNSAYGEGNAPLPESFYFGTEKTAEAWMWVDLLKGDSMDWETGLETEMPEFPGVLFRYTNGEVEAVKGGETVSLYQGMPVWSVYFADLNGDGKREICSCTAFGSGLIDDRIQVYDYANGARYELDDRGITDYGLVLDGGVLYATLRPSSICPPEEEKPKRIGELVLTEENGKMALRVENVRLYEEENASYPSEDPTGTQDAEAPDLDEAISAAILSNHGSEASDGLIQVESHTIFEMMELSPTPLAGEDPQPNCMVVYLWTLVQRFRLQDGVLAEVNGVSLPVSLTLEIRADGYVLTEYWTPRDGTDYPSEMQEKFPSSALEKAQEFSGYMEELQQQNLEKARRLLERTESENGAEQEE